MHDFAMEVLANYNLFVQRGKFYIKGYLEVLDRKTVILLYKLQRNAIAITLTLRIKLLTVLLILTETLGMFCDISGFLG